MKKIWSRSFFRFPEMYLVYLSEIHSGEKNMQLKLALPLVWELDVGTYLLRYMLYRPLVLVTIGSCHAGSHFGLHVIPES